MDSETLDHLMRAEGLDPEELAMFLAALDFKDLLVVEDRDWED